MHGKTSSIERKNGLEMYRQICNIVDAVPENYKFDFASQFISMPQVYGDKVKGLKELYQFRMLLKYTPSCKLSFQDAPFKIVFFQ